MVTIDDLGAHVGETVTLRGWLASRRSSGKVHFLQVRDGKDQVLAGREMHWLRVDRYNTGPYDAPEEFYFQPLPCMHC